MGRINYSIPDENTEERLEILEGILEDINLLIADTKMDIFKDGQKDGEGDWFYLDDEE